MMPRIRYFPLAKEEIPEMAGGPALRPVIRERGTTQPLRRIWDQFAMGSQQTWWSSVRKISALDEYMVTSNDQSVTTS